MGIAREEIFGPVLTVLAFDGDRTRASGSRTTPTSASRRAVWTATCGWPTGWPRRLRAGVVWVNSFDAADVTVPFGGFKQSGSGRDKCLHALDGYTQLKTTWVDLS